MPALRASAVKAKTHWVPHGNLPSILEPAEPAAHIAGTKVIVTLGPACHEVDDMIALLEAGMSCARIDLTWGPVEYHKQSLRNLEQAVRRTRRLCAVLVDTLGRELMIRRTYTLSEDGWPVHEQGFAIKKGAEVTVTTSPTAQASSSCLPITYPNFHTMVSPGDTVFHLSLSCFRYLANGADESSLFLEVRSVKGENVVCEAQNDAMLDGLLTVIHSSDSEQISNIQADLPLLSEHDVAAIRSIAEEHEIDFISLTFTKDGQDVEDMRDFLDKLSLEQTKILAKVENRVALLNFEAICLQADGVIFSRGNLGLDVVPEKMALVQKSCISRCNLLGKPCIVTRLVDTMVSAPRPTRAEATDVANLVLDSVDGVMLGAETLRGKYPVLTVKTVLNICRQAELVYNHDAHFEWLMADSMAVSQAPSSLVESIASTAVRCAEKIQAGLIIVYANSGRTASLIAKYRPTMPIVTLVVPTLKSNSLSWDLSGRSLARQCLIMRGVIPMLAAPVPGNSDVMLEEAVKAAASKGFCKASAHIVCVLSMGGNLVLKVVTMDSQGKGMGQRTGSSLCSSLDSLGALE
eukprot:jgi/Astpho2/8068/e_gw1.00120.16.1_t